MSIIHDLLYSCGILVRDIFDWSVLLFSLKKRTLSSENKQSVLVIRLDGIGDFVVFSPSLKDYKRLYPDHKVSLLVNSLNVELAETFSNSVDELIPFESKKFGRNLLYRRRLIKEIRDRAFDVVIDSAYSRSKAASCLVRFSGAKTRIGFNGDTCNITKREKTKTDNYYTKLIPSRPGTICEIDRNREFIEKLGVKTCNFTPVIIPTENDRIKAEQILLESGLKKGSHYVVLCLGASRKYKMWPLEKYIEVIDFLINRKKVQVILCGSKSEKSIAQKVSNTINLSLIDIIGKTTLLELAAVLEKSLLYLGNDTGVLHLAAAISVPTICILGGGHFGRFFPYGDLSKNYAIYKPMDCFGCNWRCKYSIRNGKAAPCISNIEVDAVLSAVRKVL